MFDTSGNTTSDPQGRTFIYDAENKQIEVRDSHQNIIGQYRYDGDGKRVKKTVPATGETTIFVHDASGKLVAEYSTQVESVQNAKVAYLTNDHLGSPRINTDRDGNVTSRRDFHPFGEQIFTAERTAALDYDADTVRKQFTGYERDDETGLDFAQARMYAQTLGRFNATDPYNILLEKQSQAPDDSSGRNFRNYLVSVQKWNKYSNVNNNPLRYLDPNGEDALVVVFTDYKISVGGSGKNGRVPYLGHAGIVLIDENGNTTYYDYGRFDKEEKGEVRVFKNLPKLDFTSDGVATEESVQKLMQHLSREFGQNGAIEGAYFNTNQQTTDAMKQFANGLETKNTDANRKEYSLFENNCMTFTRDVLKGGGVNLMTSSSTARPNGDIGYIQSGSYTIPKEDNPYIRYEAPLPARKPGRIPYKPSKK